MIRARKTSRWLLVLAFTMRLSSLCWLAVTSIGTGAGMIGTLPKALHYTISFMGHDTSDQHFSRSPEMRRYNKTCVASGNPSGGAAYSWQCNVEFRKDTQQGKVRA